MTFEAAPASALDHAARTVPPHVWFGVSAVFHYLGPSFAVLLFPVLGVLGVAWFRIATAALVFAPITQPWRILRRADPRTRWLLIGLGVCLAVMNTSFYLALDRLPRASFALLLALLPATATIIAAVVLAQIPTVKDLLGIALVMVGIAVHRPART